MDSRSLPGQSSRVENIKRSLTVSPVYLNNEGFVNTPLFEYISVRYEKPLELAAGVKVCVFGIGRGEGGRVTA